MAAEGWSTNVFIPADLTLMNAMYDPGFNAVFIYPALLLPPTLPENVTAAYEYAMFAIIGHEFTHGFDTNGSQFDKFGNKANWWTVADKMAFEERRDLLVSCYNHLEIDPVRKPGLYSKGDITQTLAVSLRPWMPTRPVLRPRAILAKP